jgi:hypothetical protein
MVFRLKDSGRRSTIRATVGALVLTASLSGCSSSTVPMKPLTVTR